MVKTSIPDGERMGETLAGKAMRLAPTVRRTATMGAGRAIYAVDGDSGPHKITRYPATDERDEHATCSCMAGYYGNGCSHLWALDIALAKGWAE